MVAPRFDWLKKLYKDPKESRFQAQRAEDTQYMDERSRAVPQPTTKQPRLGPKPRPPWLQAEDVIPK